MILEAAKCQYMDAKVLARVPWLWPITLGNKEGNLPCSERSNMNSPSLLFAIVSHDQISSRLYLKVLLPHHCCIGGGASNT